MVVPATTDLGRGLSEKAIKFAELRASGLHLHRAVTLAGFTPKNKRNAVSIGWTLTRDPRVAGLMANYAASMVRAAAPRAIKVLDDIMSSETAKDADRSRAAAALLSKVIPTLEHHQTEGHLQLDHVVEHRVAPSLDDLRREAGLLPAPAEHFTDADFEVVEPAHPEGGDPGLRGSGDPDEWVVD